MKSKTGKNNIEAKSHETKHEFMTINEVADRLSVSAPTVRALINDGELESVRIGKRTIRIYRKSFEKLLRRSTLNPKR